MGNLLSDLISKPQRETAGSDSALRFDYQKKWAFCQMMHKHTAGENYLVAFEYHDDILFLSPADDPNAAEFSQVKTSSASTPRTLASITNRPKGKASIVGKMLSNLDGICSSHDVRVVLVSNNAFEFADGNMRAQDLNEKFRKRLLEKLSAEILGFDEARLEKLHFLVTGVSLEAMDTFLEGKASALFCHKFGEEHGLNIRSWIRLIQNNIAQRNNYSSNAIKSIKDFIKEKCIDRALVEGTLEAVYKKSDPKVSFPSLATHFKEAGWTTDEIMSLEKRLSDAEGDSRTVKNSDVQCMREALKEIADYAQSKELGLDNYLNIAVRKIMSMDNIGSIYKIKHYPHALGILVYYEGL